MITIAIDNNNLKRYNITSNRWTEVDYLNQGKYRSSDGLRHWAGYAPLEENAYTLDHSKNLVTKIRISFTADGGGSSDKKVGVGFGISESDIEELRTNSAALDSKIYQFDIAGYTPGGKKRTIEISEGDALVSFQEAFQSSETENRQKSLAFYSLIDKGQEVNTVGKYTSNYMQISDIILEVEYRAKAAPFTKIPEKIIVGEDLPAQFEVEDLGQGYEYQLSLQLGEEIIKLNEVLNSNTKFVLDLTNAKLGKGMSSSFSQIGTITATTFFNGTQLGSNSVSVLFEIEKYTLSKEDITFSIEEEYQDKYNNPVFLEDLTKIKIGFNDSLSKYGASLTKIITYDGNTIAVSTSEHIITIKKAREIYVKVIDSRGVQLEKTMQINDIKKITFPKSNDISINRCTDSGQLDTLGENILIRDAEIGKNTLTIFYGTTLDDYQYSLSVDNLVELIENDELYSKKNFFSTEKSYYFKIILNSKEYKTSKGEAVQSSPYYLRINSGVYLLHFLNSGRGIGLGCAAEEPDEDKPGKITVAWPLKLIEPLSIEQGGTGARNPSGAWNQIVSPGGTISGNLTIGHSSPASDNSSRLKTLYINGSLTIFSNRTLESSSFKSGRIRFYDYDSVHPFKTSNGQNQAISGFYTKTVDGVGDQEVRRNQIIFYSACFTDEDQNVATGQYEYFYLPSPNRGATTSQNFDILTTKNLITSYDNSVITANNSKDTTTAEGNCYTFGKLMIQTGKEYDLGVAISQDKSPSNYTPLVSNNGSVVSEVVKDGNDNPVQGVVDIKITFQKTFSQIPTVVACLNATSTAYSHAGVQITVHSITKTDFKIRLFNQTTTNRSPNLNWIAIG